MRCKNQRSVQRFLSILSSSRICFSSLSLIVRVQNGEVAFQPHQFRMAAQISPTTNGTCPSTACPRQPCPTTGTVFHLARGLVGEGRDRISFGVPCPSAADARCARSAPLSCLCLPRHQNRAVQRLNRFALRRVQIIQIRGRALSKDPADLTEQPQRRRLHPSGSSAHPFPIVKIALPLSPQRKSRVQFMFYLRKWYSANTRRADPKAMLNPCV